MKKTVKPSEDEYADGMPKMARRWLGKMLPPYYHQAIAGDFEEEFEARQKTESRHRTLIWYLGQLLLALPMILHHFLYWSAAMISNYLKIALRHFQKHKGYSLLNVLGLAIGMACFMLIALYVHHEYSYDQFWEKSERLYRVVRVEHQKEGVEQRASSQVPLGPELQTAFPEVAAATRFWNVSRAIVGYNGQYFREANFYFSDPATCRMFDFQWLAGNPEKALETPNSIVLTASTARKYFGDENALGKILSYDGWVGSGKREFLVSGIIADLNENTHLSFDFLASLQGISTEATNWGSSKPIWTYVLLQKNASAAQLAEKLPIIVEKYLKSEHPKALHLEPIHRINLYSAYKGGFKVHNNINNLYLFSGIGFLVLLLACINFMNLSIARSLKRGKEVGMRKVLGAARSQLIKQFLGEAFLMTLIALCVAILLANICLPLFNELSGKSLQIFALGKAAPVLVLVLTALLVGIFAGSYPAFYLSAYRPVDVLKGKFQSYSADSKRGISFRLSPSILRKGLIIFQFSVSVMLMIATMVIFRQMDFVRGKELGITREEVVVLPYSPAADAFMSKIGQHPKVSAASVSQRVPVNNLNWDSGPVTRPDNDLRIDIEGFLIDENFLDTYQIELITGRNFSPEISSDNDAFILNETALKALGWHSPEEALGQPINASGWGKPGRIIGVVRNFHIGSFHEDIRPQMFHTFRQYTYWRTFISVRLKPGDLFATLAFLENTWREYTPAGVYEYFFIDESLERLHRADIRLGKIFASFALIAIIIACLGLLGVASYSAEQRTREIGVRKVLGASVPGLILLLSREFLLLTVSAFLIAAPLAYVLMTAWLQDFAYRIALPLDVFLLSGSIAFAVCLGAVVLQASKAALANPVDALRNE